MIGMSERAFRRWARRFEEEGEDGVLDRRLGRRSGGAVPEAEDVDAVAHQIAVAFLDDIAQMNADAELDAAFGWHSGVGLDMPF